MTVATVHIADQDCCKQQVVVRPALCMVEDILHCRVGNPIYIKLAVLNVPACT